ncbi:short-chain dehydrogenase [Colletotrichum abscissum]|uniref:Short-chain dehydrogenase n=1 Tax=Colletotrichum abscissum TaxID=1671311 RepID=A0A9P9XFK0_9PEZI|nr:short-chain dehydrogenase [Colletotrichum abscissum]KAI3552849.1 short-chain dehydrogenase [Colletotrichum abscissum]KAK1516427.1 short-chain dehydrogenase [Colletotrichum abscissum]
MSRFEINEKDLVGLKDKVVLVTGGSSGIGLGTVNLLLSLGARVTNVDLSLPKASEPGDPSLVESRLTFEPCNVCDWQALRGVFARTAEREGRIDAVFANAGVGARTRFIDDEIDPTDGELKAPDLSCVETNLFSVISTVKLAVHHMRKQETGGSIVLTASVSSWSRFKAVDYTTSKHAVLGLMRSLIPHLEELPVPIRLNSLAPNWTKSGIVNEEMVSLTGLALNTPEHVALSAALLMNDNNRNGEVIFIDGGKYWEIEESLGGAGVGSFVGSSLPIGSDQGTDWDRYLEFSRRMNLALKGLQ